MESIQDIQIDMIEPNPNQPRKHFDDESLQELADSIKSKGLLEPIVVRPLADKYQIVCGERRWRACKIAGLETIQGIVRGYLEIRDKSRVEKAIRAVNERTSPHPDPDIANRIWLLQFWGFKNTELTLDQFLWHDDYWAYHSRVEKGLCWVYGCENQPTIAVRHHWYNSDDIPSTAIYRSTIKMCYEHGKNVSRDT